MKIGFPYLHQNNSEKILLDLSLHTCKSFGIFDVESKHTVVKDVSSLLQENKSDLSTYFALEAVDILLTQECSPMAAKYFRDNNITVYKSEGNDLITNLILLSKSELFEFHAGNVKQSSCGSSCSTCSSTCKSA